MLLIFVERVIAGAKTALVIHVARVGSGGVEASNHIWRVAEAFSRLFVVGCLSTIVGRCIKSNGGIDLCV